MKDMVAASLVPKFRSMGQLFWHYVRATNNPYQGELPTIHRYLDRVKVEGESHCLDDEDEDDEDEDG